MIFREPLERIVRPQFICPRSGRKSEGLSSSRFTADARAIPKMKAGAASTARARGGDTEANEERERREARKKSEFAAIPVAPLGE